jgi:hypothetical protein
VSVTAIGSVTRRTATQLAEDAISRLGRRRQKYAVAMSPSGVVSIGAVDDFPDDELLMVCTAQSDPDVLADNIRDAAGKIGERRFSHRVRN